MAVKIFSVKLLKADSEISIPANIECLFKKLSIFNNINPGGPTHHNNPKVILFIIVARITYAQRPRARDIGIPFTGTRGKYNAITDVAGVEVGYSTIISGSGKNHIGKGPVRTGVTAIFPNGKVNHHPVFANWYTLNGNGEMTGTTWVTESGILETPVMITNTNSVGVVRDAVLKWFIDKNWYKDEEYWYTYPVVAETYDGAMNCSRRPDQSFIRGDSAGG